MVDHKGTKIPRFALFLFFSVQPLLYSGENKRDAVVHDVRKTCFGMYFEPQNKGCLNKCASSVVLITQAPLVDCEDFVVKPSLPLFIHQEQCGKQGRTQACLTTAKILRRTMGRQFEITLVFLSFMHATMKHSSVCAGGFVNYGMTLRSTPVKCVGVFRIIVRYM